MYKDYFLQLGLTEGQGEVYESLLLGGEMRASVLSKRVEKKRALVYRILEDLVGMGLVEKKESSAVSAFCAKHPSFLEGIMNAQEQKIRDMRASLGGVLPSMISDFNLASGKPGVRFFEGKDGVEKVLDDSLRVGKEENIYTYADIEAVNAHIKTINDQYVKKRERLKIQKKALILDTPFARDFMKTYYTKVTDTRLIPPATPIPFRSLMEIYSGKVSYITFEKDRMIGVIIEDGAIYDMHRYLFESMWEKAERVGKKVEF